MVEAVVHRAPANLVWDFASPRVAATATPGQDGASTRRGFSRRRQRPSAPAAGAARAALHAHTPRSRGVAGREPEPLRAAHPARAEGRALRPAGARAGDRARALGPAARAAARRAAYALTAAERAR